MVAHNFSYNIILSMNLRRLRTWKGTHFNFLFSCLASQQYKNNYEKSLITCIILCFNFLSAILVYLNCGKCLCFLCAICGMLNNLHLTSQEVEFRLGLICDINNVHFSSLVVFLLLL